MAAIPSIALCPALIVDADPAAQQRLRQVLQSVDGPSVSVAAVADLAAAKARLEATEFSLVLADTGPLGVAGIEFIGWVHAHCPKAACVVVTTWGRKERVMAALRAGAAGYLLKERDDAELARALASVQSGGVPIDPAVARCMLDELTAGHAPSMRASGAGVSRLSEREAEILNLVSRGCSNREIAAMTSLSRFTVESHIKKVYRKLSVGSRTAAVFEAKAMGLLQ